MKQMCKFLVMTTFALLLSACGGSDDKDDLADIAAYKTDSPYRNVMKDCVRANNIQQSCTLQVLPTLGMEYNDPGIPQIMERVIVSHAWMGERFEELLHELPQEMLPLFRGITAIVIDADIRPSYYYQLTGAIYLDPQSLWLNLEEKANVSKKQDYRAGFDDPLDFRALRRFVKDGQSIYSYGSLFDNSTRELEDIVLEMASLLLHELGHANDFLPPQVHMELNPALKVYEAISGRQEQWISSQLDATDPLTSETLYSLAGVMFRGNDPTPADLEISAGEVGVIFANDGAADIYGYTTQFEDMAMLFEIAMMKHFFNADYEVAFAETPSGPGYCNDYLLAWGVRNRLGHDDVSPRAEFVAGELLPAADFAEFFANLDDSTDISGDWCLFSPPDGSLKPHLHPIDSRDLIRPYL